jgi:hypothetical protein
MNIFQVLRNSHEIKIKKGILRLCIEKIHYQGIQYQEEQKSVDIVKASQPDHFDSSENKKARQDIVL